VTASEPTYAEAIAELESIVASLERDELDVDVLGARVARAAELIALCRDRIAGTRMEVERLVAGLDPPAAGAGAAGGDDDAGGPPGTGT
jgi:exodeoxyribonuclease VII small subunit